MGVNHRVTEAFSAALSGSRRGLARAITLVENRTPGINQAIASLEPRRLAAPGGPHVLGITGPPGAGKSTFTNRIVEAARAEQRTVAVVAVDPSSPFSGGAILGDIQVVPFISGLSTSIEITILQCPNVAPSCSRPWRPVWGLRGQRSSAGRMFWQGLGPPASTQSLHILPIGRLHTSPNVDGWLCVCPWVPCWRGV